MENTIPILILLGLAIMLSIGILGISYVLGPKNPLATKLSPYECGVSPEGGPHTPFVSQFYLIAVLFLLIDVEATFFFPWALVYRTSLSEGPLLLIALIIYVVIFSVGLLYILRKNCLKLN